MQRRFATVVVVVVVDVVVVYVVKIVDVVVIVVIEVVVVYDVFVVVYAQIVVVGVAGMKEGVNGVVLVVWNVEWKVVVNNTTIVAAVAVDASVVYVVVDTVIATFVEQR